MKTYIISLLLFFCGFQLSSFAQFSQKELAAIKVLSKGADVIVTGKVAKQKSSWNKDKTRIYTQATLQVDEYLKGNSGNSVVVTYPGGEVGDVGELYTHMPRFTNDENVLVFLKKDQKDNDYIYS